MSVAVKRKFNEMDEGLSLSSTYSSINSEWDSDGGGCHSDTLDSRPRNPGFPAMQFPTTSILKKANRARRGHVQFDQVTVFFFPRCQGFTSVPSQGGCTLGMVWQHSACRQYTMAEFAVERHHLRWEKLKNRLKEEKLEALRQKLTKNGTRESEEADRLTVDDISEDDLNLSSVNVQDGFHLHPYSSKRRHTVLKAAGVKKIDREEKRQLHDIRLSREDCGCDCQGFCEPETCACSLAGIKCQMDHSSFPCGCTKDSCGNIEGRIEFNSGRVRTHYIHTTMKLELEKRLEESADPGDQAKQQPEISPFTPEEDCTVPASPSFHFNSELAIAGENSCSSDMTDFSSSSGRSEDSETGRGSPSAQAQLDMDENGLARILSFTDSSSEDGSDSSRETSCNQWRQQPSTGSGDFSPADFFNDDDSDAPSSAASDHTDNQTLSASEVLDENANQGASFFHKGPIPNTPSPSIDQSSSYMDLSLSSDSDLEFFDGFPYYRPGGLDNSLKVYENLDNFFQFQYPVHTSHTQANDPGTCFLESLIGLSESIPEPPTTCIDNQLLEEAIKSSMSESVKV